MTEPQVWVLIGVFAAIMIGGFTLTTTLLLRAMKSGFETVDAKFEVLNVKLEHLDRDVSALMRHTFGIAE
ncbi:hypothetical protein J4H92_09650 [Leucobacter weissii]|uniref:Uncharacterized protein n=1 Tax=Leucobacter weissii TaxID=1983706 RepID=A0A939MSI9_9MICO|nr:hypothetical protein [Leucobacter weissii]